MVKISGGDGSSLGNAIIISECTNSEGIHQEYIEIEKRFGTYRFIQQSLLSENDCYYDVLKIEVEGEILEVYFDITDFFGKGFK